MIYAVGYAIMSTILRIFNITTIKGKENIPDGPIILAGNHTTWTDPVFMAMALGHKQRPLFMAKVELVKGKPFEKLLTKILKAGGVFFIDREHGSLGAIRKSMEGLRAGKKLVIFPEGTRVHKGQHVAAKGGVITLAYMARVPVVPVYITPGFKHIFKRTKVIIGEPRYYKYDTKPLPADFENDAEKLMEEIRSYGEKK